MSWTLGEARCFELADLGLRVGTLQDLIDDAGTVEMVSPLMPASTANSWARSAGAHEHWVAASTADGDFVAMDEVTPEGEGRAFEAVFFPELHSRLVAWWLVHAWRSADLIEDTLRALAEWRIPTAAVTGRALLEEAGALVYEARRIFPVWKEIKSSQEDADQRAGLARETLGPVLLAAGMGTRLPGVSEKSKATNVLTYISGLQRATGDDRFTKWYDWLSDAAHPAFGARIALSSPPMAHDSRAMIIRFHARDPQVRSRVARDGTPVPGTDEPLRNEIADYLAESLITTGNVVLDVLNQSLVLVDDFGLTTEASLLTRRSIWRGFRPVRGSRQCPCGRGKWAACGHRWGEPAPTLEIPQTGGQ